MYWWQKAIKDPEPIVELQHIFTELFDRAGFDLVIDY
jgi:hypothetical protein